MILNPVNTQTLDFGWTLFADNLEAAPTALRERLACGISASVPGEAAVDLLNAGLIPDPFDADNEVAVQWIGDIDWRYECRFDWHDDGAIRHDLVALGIDTIATLTLNGQLVDAVENAFRTYRWDVRGMLRDGENLLTVRFRSPVAVTNELEHRRGFYPHAERFAFNQIRKPAYGFGWDWGIAVPSAGIIQPIAIESWSGVRVYDIRPLVDVELADVGKADCGTLDIAGSIERADTGRVTDMMHPYADKMPVDLDICVDHGDTHIEQRITVPADRTTFRIRLDVNQPDLWWPIGYGGQPLYDISVTPVALHSDDYSIGWHGRIGFRSVHANTSIDELGRPFQLIVNGQPIHVRGYNWIPASVFVSQVTADDYKRLMCDLIESNTNMLRIWGGGIYESDDLYELADEQGMLIWQDFMFACAMYPEEVDMVAQVEDEAREQIVRLSSHPSLVIWNGSNENYVAYAQWDDYRQGLRDEDRAPDAYGGREKPWGELYYDTVIPKLLNQLDPTRLYLPSSPMSFNKHAAQSSDVDGTIHIWDVWNSADYRKYADYTPRFADEFGYQGPPAWSTLTRVVHDKVMDPFSPQMLAHQKANLGNYKIARGMRSHLTPGSFDDMDWSAQGGARWLIDTDRWDNIEDWHWAAQLQQAQAVRFAIAHMRSLEPVNAGILIWQINDDWPVISWSAVDYDGHRKPLWYASKRAYAPYFATIQPSVSEARLAAAWPGIKPEPDGISLHVVNDGMTSIDGTWSLRRTMLDGTVLAEADLTCAVGAHDAVHVEIPDTVAQFDDVSNEIIVADFFNGDGSASLTFDRVIYDPVDVIDQRLHSDVIEATIEASANADGYLLSVRATSYVRDLFCMVDKVCDTASVDDGMISLLAGEELVLHICSPVVDAPDRFTAPNVLRSANDLRHR